MLLRRLLKTADVSKAELKEVLKKHEERETPAQEAAESKEEQRVEREAGVEPKEHKTASHRDIVGRVGQHLNKNFDRYVAGLGTAAAISGARSGKRSADARERQVDHFTKKAFFSGFMKKRREKGHAEAHQGFWEYADGFNTHAAPHHPIPEKTLRAWADKMTPEAHRNHREGFNHFAESSNAWFQTREGDAWNSMQARKAKALEKKGSALIGFEKQAITFNIKHQLDAGADVTKSLRKLRNLRSHHLAVGGLAAGLGFGGGMAAGKRLVNAIGKKDEPKPAE